MNKIPEKHYFLLFISPLSFAFFRHLHILRRYGGVAEWLKAHAWKVCMRETVSRVRIPPPPPGSNATKSNISIISPPKILTTIAANFNAEPDDSFLTWKIIGLKGLRNLIDQYRCAITFHQNPQQRLNILI